MSTLGRIRQPWFFVVLAAGFGVIAYFASGGSPTRAVIGGLAFAVLMSLWRRLRFRRW